MPQAMEHSTRPVCEEIPALDPAPQKAKKPYQKPAFRREKVFETTALACGKVQSTQAGCHGARKAS
jgi:hypothetical protein